MTNASKLRALLETKPILKIMGAHHALGAKLVEKHGFDGIWASGFELATSRGVPDANILTMTENLEVASSMIEATSIPLICDCDTGYGNASNVMHMVKKYEAADVAAVVIEDKHFPKMNSFIPGRQELASIEEFQGKLEAAKSVRRSDDGLLIFARVEALIAGWGMEEALKRALAYREAGADGIVIHSKSKNPDEIYTFAKRWREKVKGPVPLVAIPTTYNQVTDKELAANGFKIAIYANQGMRASVKAINEVFAQISREGTTKNIEGNIATMKELFGLQGMSTYQENEKRYARTGEQIDAVIPAAADHRFQPDLSDYLKDKPLCMLEIAGKPLLEHQLDILRSVNIRDFHVVSGFLGDKVKATGIDKIQNDRYNELGSAYSLIQGLEHAKGRVLACYADIIFDRKIPESLLSSPYPVTLVIDRAFKTLPRRDKVLDMVVTASDSSGKDIRKMQLQQFKAIQSIGKKIDLKEAHHEFIGMLMLSEEGVHLVKKAWEKCQAEFKGKPFYESESGAKASVTDLIHYMIDLGRSVHGLEVEHGWSEIYSLTDYERVNAYISKESSQASGTSTRAL